MTFRFDIGLIAIISCTTTLQDADSGLENWELALKKNIESETKFSKVKPAKAWNEDAAILQLIKKEVENKKDLTQLVGKIEAAIKAQAA